MSCSFWEDGCESLSSHQGQGKLRAAHGHMEGPHFRLWLTTAFQAFEKSLPCKIAFLQFEPLFHLVWVNFKHPVKQKGESKCSSLLVPRNGCRGTVAVTFHWNAEQPRPVNYEVPQRWDVMAPGADSVVWNCGHTHFDSLKFNPKWCVHQILNSYCLKLWSWVPRNFWYFFRDSLWFFLGCLKKEKGDSGLWRFPGLCRSPESDISVLINALWEAGGSVEGFLFSLSHACGSFSGGHGIYIRNFLCPVKNFWCYNFGLHQLTSPCYVHRTILCF